MYKFTNLYLKILPILGLVGIILGALRTAFESTLTIYILISTLILDVIVIVLGRRYLNKPIIHFVGLLMLISVFVGLFNDVELSRRYITDVTNPLFFFCKILIFKEYWKTSDFTKYAKYYTKIGVIGSIILLPIAYYIYSLGGVNRIAIFPPLELPYAYYLQGSPYMIILVLILILLYGKRAQLVGALVIFIAFIVLFRKKSILKYAALAMIGIVIAVVVFREFSENNAIRRLTSTYDKVMEAPSLEEGFASVSAGRDDEISSVLALMETDIDYIFGLGVGFTYDLGVYVDKDVSNVHFTPIGFYTKYGIIFTIFIYFFLFRTLFSFRRHALDREFIIVYSLFVFIFIESFFSYSLFVTPLAAVCIGYLQASKSLQNAQ